MISPVLIGLTCYEIVALAKFEKNTSFAQHFLILGPPTPSAHNMWLRTVERSEICSLNPTSPSSKKSYIGEPLRVTERRGYNVPVNTVISFFLD